MSVQNETHANGETTVLDRPAVRGVYASLFEKINLNPLSALSDLNVWQNNQTMSDATANSRINAHLPYIFLLSRIPHFQVEGMDVNLSLVSQMPKAKA